MRTGTVSYRLEDLKNRVIIPIGFVGENDFTRVIFDAEEIYKKYPNASVSMKVQPPKGGVYPAAVTRDGNNVIWQVKEADVANRGGGELQLTFTDGDTKIKTYIARTDVKRSLAGNGPAPDPVQDWVDNAEEVLEEVEAAEINQPTIGQDGYWYTWNQETGEYVKSDTKAQGADGAQGQDGAPGRDGTDATPTLVCPAYADLTFPVTKDTLCYKDGTLYKAKQDISTSESWTAAHWDATNIDTELRLQKSAIQGIGVVSVDNFGAKGDGVTDDTEAIRAAINSGYEVKFGSDKTYLITEPIIISKDIKLVGGSNTWIKNIQLENDKSCFVIVGELKETTTMTTDYTTKGNTDNSGNRFTLNDMSNVEIGDILVIEATDQYYSYARQYYYLGGTLLVSDTYEGHIYTSNSLPFDIENTENVTVRVYSAPTAIIEGLNFVSDINERERFYYRYCIELTRCKNSVVKNCKTTNTDMGIIVQQSVNTLIDGVTLAKSKYDNTITADGYGIFIFSSTNTIVQRVLSICSQGCIDLGGTIPNIDTFIYNCNLNSECRPIGIDMHENSYNVVIEDCTLGGLLLYGTATVNRCRFIRNNRVNRDPSGIVFGGSHNEKFSKVRITNCIFDAAQQVAGVSFSAPVTQDPIQSFNNIIGTAEIENCEGGALIFNQTTSETILSNVVKKLIIKNWKNCYEFYHTNGSVVEYMAIIDSTFIKPKWANSHNDNINLDGINYLHISSDNPQRDKLIVKLNGKGRTYKKLQKGRRVTITANSESDHYIVCGENIASNKIEDYNIGSVSGTSGNPLSRTIKTGFDNALSNDENGNIVFTQPNNTTTWALYNKCMFYVEKDSVARMSCKIKNTGQTTGITMRAFIAVVDATTNLVKYRNNGDTAQATENGATITHSITVDGNSYVLCYVTCSTAIENAETTIENFVAEVFDIDMVADPIQFKKYVGNSLDGSGYIETVEGINNIMASSPSFVASFKTDLI